MGKSIFLHLLLITAGTLDISFCQENRQPEWIGASADVLKEGVSEATQVDDSLTDLQCTDPEGDQVLYTKISGKVVYVLSNGTVKLAQPLDFESPDTLGSDISFGCYDIDGFGFSRRLPSEYSIYRTELTVDDANDNAPIFTTLNPEGYTYTIPEDAANGTDLTPVISITDADRAINARLDQLYFLCKSPNLTERALQPETSKETCEKFTLEVTQDGEGRYTASISLNGDLDYETRAVYSSKLVAIDLGSGGPKFSTTINVQINVGDAQDIDPVFTNLGSTTSVSEGAQQGQVLNFAISARDGDIGDRRPVKLSIIEDEENAFYLGDTVLQPPDVDYKAFLVVNNSLDREEISGAYYFTVKVVELDEDTLEETTASASATYSVSISDINDETPEFERDLYIVNVTEMARTTEAVQITGLGIVCEDRDQPSNAEFRVRIVNQTFPDVFSISPDIDFVVTANIFLSVERTEFADYDVPEYRTQTIWLEALEIRTANPKSSYTTVIFSLTDVNDNTPKFDEDEYSVTINENVTATPSIVTTLKATDDDSGDNGKIRYEVDNGISGPFSLNPETGELTLLGPVDYEDVNQYVFLVYAKDGGEDSKSSQVQVIITIENFNDEPPTFSQNFYQGSVNEGETQFLVPLTVRADDDEDGTVGVTYRIVEGQTADNVFILDSISGRLTLQTGLRYEDTDRDANNRTTGRFHLIVEASDNTPPAQTATVTVTINVIDQNNYGPVLEPDRYSKILSELAAPGTVVAEIKGTDDDEGDFGKITYRMDSGGYDNFAVHPDSGVVTVNDPQNFDYDEFKSYTVRIKATDGGSPQRSAFAIISVVITDANNKNPEFAEAIYTGTIDEEKPINTTILTVYASDKDSTKDLRYSIIRDSIRARDGGGAELTLSSSYDYVNAIAIDEKSGVVYVNGLLDKELALDIAFTVQVEDVAAAEGTRPQIHTTQVSLTVTGKIEDGIVFEVVNQNFMNENSYDEINLVASDPLFPQDSLNFFKDSGSSFFDVTLSGIVRANQEIDFETDPPTHQVVVRAVARDNLRSATATLTINILDVNDNAPEFDQTIYYASVDEDALYPARVTTIRATDVDSSSYGPVVYRIGSSVSSSDFELFYPDFGVDVLVAKGRTLDYNRQSVYNLDIIANDNPTKEVSGNQNFKTVRLQIKVNDKNNNRPIFQYADESRQMAVAETAPVGKSVGTVLATDADFGVNGDVSYFLQVDPNEPDSSTGLQLFRIIEELGTIVVDRSLIGLGGKQYPMTVRATDGGEPSNSAYLDIIISVLSTEINDGTPLWVVPSEDYVAYITEELSNEVVINANYFQVTPRTGNGTTFSLSSLTTYDGTFEIDSITGEITVTRSLDREIRETYTLVVYARDNSDPDIRSGRQITVNVNDLNDNDATFKNPKGYDVCGEPIEDAVTVIVEENTDRNEFVYQVSACDADGPGNNEVTYQPYTDDNDCHENFTSSAFEIKSDGRLMTTRIIDHEERREYTLCVEARSVIASTFRVKRQVDQNLPENVVVLYIVIMDQNDNGPEFPEDSITAVMNIRPSNLDTVVWLDAVDPDGEDFNSIKYTITSITYHEAGETRRVDDLFVVKSRYAIAPSRTNYETYIRGYFVMEVLATDVLNSQFQDTQTILVFLYRSTQSIKIIVDRPPQEGYTRAGPLENALNAASSDGHRFVFLQASEHTDDDEVDASRTDLCFLGVDTNNNRMLDKASLIRVLAYEEYGQILEDYDAIDTGACYPVDSSEDSVEWRRLWWVLVAIAIFIFVCCLIFIVLVCILYRRYKRYMKSKQMYLVAQ